MSSNKNSHIRSARVTPQLLLQQSVKGRLPAQVERESRLANRMRSVYRINRLTSPRAPTDQHSEAHHTHHEPLARAAEKANLVLMCMTPVCGRGIDDRAERLTQAQRRDLSAAAGTAPWGHLSERSLAPTGDLIGDSSSSEKEKTLEFQGFRSNFWRRGWDSNPRYGCPYA